MILFLRHFRVGFRLTCLPACMPACLVSLLVVAGVSRLPILRNDACPIYANPTHDIACALCGSTGRRQGSSTEWSTDASTTTWLTRKNARRSTSRQSGRWFRVLGFLAENHTGFGSAIVIEKTNAIRDSIS